MDNPQIVATGPIDEPTATALAEFGEIVITPDVQGATIRAHLDRAIALIVRGEAEITADLINEAQHVKVISRSGVGYNNVDITAATARGIPVVITPGAASKSMAEGAIAMMLTLSKQLIEWHAKLKSGDWQCRFDANHRDLDGATLGIVGFGRIGQSLAHLAKAFGMHVIAYDPFINDADATEMGVSLMSLDDLMAQSDYISIHAALTDDTQGLINKENLQKVKRGAYLINLARGGLIDSLDDVCDALQDGRLAGAGIDVFDPEPPEMSHPIFKQANCITTPHVIGISQGAIARIFRFMVEDTVAILRGDRPRPGHVVNPEVLS